MQVLLSDDDKGHAVDLSFLRQGPRRTSKYFVKCANPCEVKWHRTVGKHEMRSTLLTVLERESDVCSVHGEAVYGAHPGDRWDDSFA